MRIISIFILLISSLLSQGQLVKEYNIFLSDTTLTSWKEYEFCPGSYEDNNYLSFHAQKDTKLKIVNEKAYDYYSGLEYWTITFYNNKWQIIEEVELNPDSSLISKEKLTFMNDGSIVSQCYDKDGIKDSTTIYTYFSNGELSSYKFLIEGVDSAYYWQEGKYIRGENELLKKSEEYKIEINGERALTRYKDYFYTENRLDSILTHDLKYNWLARKVYSYKKQKLDIISSTGGYSRNQIEKIIYNNPYQITIIDYNDRFGCICTIKKE